MAILVDELRAYPGRRLPFTEWCHLAVDGSFAELHAFAARLGLRRAWFQGDHYDLPPHGRAAAVALGAEPVPTAELLLRMAGPRGDRARRRSWAPDGTTVLRGAGGPRVLRVALGSLVVVAGSAGTGAPAVAARLAGGGAVPVLDLDPAGAAAALRAGAGAVAVGREPTAQQLVALAAAARTAAVAAHLLVLGGGTPGAPAGFASVTVVADRTATDRLRRLSFGEPGARRGP